MPPDAPDLFMLLEPSCLAILSQLDGAPLQLIPLIYTERYVYPIFQPEELIGACLSRVNTLLPQDMLLLFVGASCLQANFPDDPQEQGHGIARQAGL